MAANLYHLKFRARLYDEKVDRNFVAVRLYDAKKILIIIDSDCTMRFRKLSKFVIAKDRREIQTYCH